MIAPHKLLIAALVGASLAGCSGSSEPVADSKGSTTGAPVMDPSKLPANMPPEARKSAEAAIGQSNAMNAQMDAEAAAMKRAQANAGGN